MDLPAMNGRGPGGATRRRGAAPEALRRAGLVLAMLLPAACGGGSIDLAPGAANVAVGPGTGRGTAPPVDMTGRWMLSSTAGGQCAMNFTSTQGAPEGAIRPEGGCPGDFFTSRKWTFEENALVIRNHNGEPLGRLTMAGAGRFDGQATGGSPIALAR